MTQNKNQKHIKYLDANKLYRYAMFKFFLTSEFDWVGESYEL